MRTSFERSILNRGPVIVIVLAMALAGAAQAQWRMLGPFGGNARTLAFEPSHPDHILLGSGAGSLFESLDGGLHWRPFAQLGTSHGLMMENIAFDPTNPATIYAGGWSISGAGGGFFLTRDGGQSWSQPSDLQGKSIQALALAGSDSRTVIAGALDGLFRSQDGGESWVRISPAGHPDLKNFESVAIDPRDPKIIYAGTWHLPWKTTDGGLHWSNVKQGLIDDSDVFSIILDQGNPLTVYASACSGIYKSDDGGQLFHKVQGIPNSARRTRVLQQDPANANTVYAGTTEGLWKTTDGGKDFQLISPPNFILNDVLVDPRNSRRLLIATDHGGVFASDDAGQTFYPLNDGFSQRQVTALVADPQEPSDLYVGVLNDKEYGGVFHRHDGRWTQLSEGLGTSDVFDLQRSPAGQLVAATNHGLYLFEAVSKRWEPSRTLLIETKTPVGTKAPARKAGPSRNGTKNPAQPVAKITTRSTFEGRATALALGSRRWYAATAAGILVSDNQGSSWSRGAVDGERDFYSVSVRNQTVAASTLHEVWYSSDEGEHWSRQALPSWVTRIYSVTVSGDDELWIATREGALRWRHTASGATEWEHVLNGLPSGEVTSIRLEGDWLLATAASTVYVSRNQGKSWEAEPSAGFEVTGAVMQRGKFYAITRQHGVLERESVSSAVGDPILQTVKR